MVWVTSHGCSFFSTAQVTPSEECIDVVLTNNPRNITIAIVFVIAFVVFVGSVYDVVGSRYLGEVIRDYLINSEARVQAEAASAEAKHRRAA